MLTMCFSVGFLTEYGIGLPDYKTMGDADKYLQVCVVSLGLP